METSEARPLKRPRDRYWLHILLFALTLVTTTFVGARLAFDFDESISPMSRDDFEAFARLFREPGLLIHGLPYSLTLLLILIAHEMGHYVACRFYGVNASLPYFIPFPIPIGTMGAFIRIRSPILTRAALFDIGVAGPLAGFLFALPAFAIGVAESKILPDVVSQGDLIFGSPLLQQALEFLVFPGTPANDIYLHPIARAAWVGVLATALNLLPIGQLDGGHILYAFFSRHHKLLSRLFVAALIPLGIEYSRSWLVWAALILFFGMRHPVIHDRSQLGTNRILLGVLALVIFIGCFTAVPIHLSEIGQ